MPWPDRGAGPEAPQNQLGVLVRPLRGTNSPATPEPSAAILREDSGSPLPWDLRVRGSITDALRAASKLAAKPLSSSIAVLSAQDGSFALFGMGIASYNHYIDGPQFDQIYTDARFTKSNPALQAVVGATHWIDLRSDAAATRSPLPANHLR